MRACILRSIPFVLICFLISALLMGKAIGVERGKTSYTAEAVCAFRSIGALDTDPKTRNPDHMATQFVNPQTMGGFPGLGMDYEDAKVAMDQMDHGVFYYVNARTHHIDAMLTKALKAGIDQVVIMGAGFDSRAYRFHEAHPKVHFFEIDLPATSEDKQQRVEKILGKRPEWVTFVPIDFNKQTLEEVLGRTGFKKNRKTFYVWEGVTYFISEFGVDSTLQFIAENSAPGSRVVFDYMLEDVVQGLDYSPYGARRVVYHVALRGEPYVFGIAPDAAEAFINLRGLKTLSDLGPEDLTKRYLIRSDGTPSGRISEFLRIVLAEVPESPVRDQLRRQTKGRMEKAAQNKRVATGDLVDVPENLRSFLDRYSDLLLKKKFSDLKDCFSTEYRFDGWRRDAVVTYIQRMYGNRQLQKHKITLTRLQIDGNRAKLDGFVSRKGYRTPLMVRDIIKEEDGHWRWYGNQQ